MLFRQGTLAGLTLAATAVAAPTAPQTNQFPSRPIYSPNPQRAAAVKEAFNFAWAGYYEYAFPHDTLRPVSNGWYDDRNSWGASAVDAFTTAIIMENQQVVNQILKHIETVDFTHSATGVSLFETTIRYLGGMVAGYDLLTGPLSKLNSNHTQVKTVLTQAKSLADALKVAFDTPSGIPDNGVDLSGTTPARTGSTTNGAATIGTLILEWQRLSDLTGDPSYGQLARKGESYLINPQPTYNEPWPGLIGSNFDIATGAMLDSQGAWTGGTDSFYEYLIKMYVYDKGSFGDYLARWKLAAGSSIAQLASHPSSRPDLTFLASYNNKTLEYYSQHLACFDGGNFVLGGLVLSRPDLVRFGLTLTTGCHDTYTATATQIGPESFEWQDSKTQSSAPPADQAAFYQKSGYWIDSAGYDLRPEVLESYYYAYRATGDKKYQDWSWEAFVAINATCRTGSGFSAVNNVNVAGGGGFADDQESFFFAEVLKYSYMIHAEDAEWQVKADGTNKFVFNTEAHPIRVKGGSV